MLKLQAKLKLLSSLSTGDSVFLYICVVHKRKRETKNISRVKKKNNNNFCYLFCIQRERTCSVAKLLIKVTVLVGCNPIATSRGNKSHLKKKKSEIAFYVRF